jgi:hypothetical protein
LDCPLSARGGHRHRKSRPLRAGAKIQGSTDPLGEVICFSIPCARRGFQRVIGDFIHKEVFFFILVAGHVIHGTDPHAHGVLALKLNSALTPLNRMSPPKYLLSENILDFQLQLCNRDVTGTPNSQLKIAYVHFGH